MLIKESKYSFTEIYDPNWDFFTRKNYTKNIITLLESVNFSDDHLVQICYHLFLNKKWSTIRSWWHNKNPRLSLDLIEENLWRKLLSVLHLYRFGMDLDHSHDNNDTFTLNSSLKVLSDNPTSYVLQPFLLLIKAPGLRSLYPFLFKKFKEVSIDKGKTCTSHDQYNDIIPIVESQFNILRYLVETASGIPNGITILYNEWKRYPDYRLLSQESLEALWNFSMDWRLEEYLSYRLNIFNNNCYNPFLTSLRYGSATDLNFWFKHPEYWKIPCGSDYPNHKLYGKLNPLKIMMLNKFPEVLRKFIYWGNTTYSSLYLKFGPTPANKIWRYSQGHIGQYFTKNEILDTLDLFKYETKMPIKRIKLKLGYLGKIKNIENINIQELLYEKLLLATNDKENQMILCKSPNWDYFSKKIKSYNNPKHVTPIDLVELSRADQILISPKADGLLYKNSLPMNCYPNSTYINIIDAEQIKLPDGRTLYLVYDIDLPCTFPERQNFLLKSHSIQSKLDNYQKQTNTDICQLINKDQIHLQDFIQTTKNNKDLNIWWVKPFYHQNQSYSEFLKLLDQSPITIYPNDGWIILGYFQKSRELLLKVKPYDKLTIDVDYRQYQELVLSTQSKNQIPFEFNYPEWKGVKQFVWRNNQWSFHKDRDDKSKGNKLEIIQLLTLQHKYPWTPSNVEEWSFESKKQIYYNYNSRCYEKFVDLPKEINNIIKEYNRIKELNEHYQFFNLGGGYSIYVYDNNHFHIRINPYDLDPYVLLNSKNNLTNMEKDNHWLDMVTFTHPITNKPLMISSNSSNSSSQPKLNIFLIQHAIHFTAQNLEKFTVFMENLTNFGCQMAIIHFIDGEEFDELKDQTYIFTSNFDESELNSNQPSKTSFSYIKRIDRMSWDPDLYQAERLLLWNSENPQIEFMVTTKFLRKWFFQYGWQESCYLTDKSNSVEKWILFTKD